MSAAVPSPESQRLFFLDWLRILAFGLLVPYHVGMVYVSWDWHVKSAAASSAIEPLMRLSSPWRLSLLFLVSGVATATLLSRRSSGFVGQRSKRLMWPVVFGMLVVVPPQAYYEVVTKVQYAGSYADFMRLYLSGYSGFCRGTDCLALPTWNHLWFVVYLWAYSLIAWLLWRHAAPAIAAAAATITRWRPWQLFLLPALPLMAARCFVGVFPSTHNLVWDWYNHLQYLPVFVMGLLFARCGAPVWDGLRRLRWPALLVALLAWALIVVYFRMYADTPPPETLRWAQRLLYGALQWWAMVAACGFARQHLDVDHRWRRYLVPAVFCIYILHQTVIILLTRVLLPWQLAPLPEGLLLIGLTFVICLAAYTMLRDVPILRGALGIVPRPIKPAPDAFAAPAAR